MLPLTRFVSRPSTLALAAATLLGSACVSADPAVAPTPTRVSDVAGSYQLRQVAGLSLPAVIDSAVSTTEDGTVITRFRLDSATVALSADGRWTQQLYLSGWNPAAPAAPTFTARFGDEGTWRMEASGVALSRDRDGATAHAMFSAQGALELSSLPSTLDGAESLVFARR